MVDMAQTGTSALASERRLAPSPGSNHSSLITRRRSNQSLAKQNRKPSQLIENNHHQPKSIASFCRVFSVYRLLQAPPTESWTPRKQLQRADETPALRSAAPIWPLSSQLPIP